MNVAVKHKLILTVLTFWFLFKIDVPPVDITVHPSFSFFDSKKTRTAQVLLKSIMKVNSSNIFVVVEISDIYDEN